MSYQSVKSSDKLSSILSKDYFDAFFRENYHTACLVALRYVPDTDRAEDLVQDVFVALWEKRENLDIKVSLRNYFFTAVKNHALNVARRDPSKIISISFLLSEVADEESSSEYDDEEMAVAIYKAIGELPGACRRIFSLAYLENYTYQQIADELSISRNTVKTQMGIAYRQLRTKLEKLVSFFIAFISGKVPLSVYFEFFG